MFAQKGKYMYMYSIKTDSLSWWLVFEYLNDPSLYKGITTEIRCTLTVKVGLKEMATCLSIYV